MALLLARAPAGAVVVAWRSGTTLHLSNDPAAAPAGTGVRRFERRSAAVAVAAPTPPQAGAAASSRQAPAMPPQPGQLHAPTVPVVAAAPAAPAIVVAPTIVIRQSSPVLVVRHGAGETGPRFLPTGFIGHEHPQVGFLRGRRLAPHSHFFGRGRAGRFTPYGHFSRHGLLLTTVPGD